MRRGLLLISATAAVSGLTAWWYSGEKPASTASAPAAPLDLTAGLEDPALTSTLAQANQGTVSIGSKLTLETARSIAGAPLSPAELALALRTMTPDARAHLQAQIPELQGMVIEAGDEANRERDTEAPFTAPDDVHGATAYVVDPETGPAALARIDEEFEKHGEELRALMAEGRNADAARLQNAIMSRHLSVTPNPKAGRSLIDDSE
jgi:hypothetical protein